MRVRTWLLLLALAVLVGGGTFGIYAYRHRFVRNNQEVVALLPPGDLSLVYADIDTMRRAGLLGLLRNIQVAPGKEYDGFIQTTDFDYTRDLDAVAVGMDSQQTYMVGRGRFHWDKLTRFAVAHGGRCSGDACTVPGTMPGRWVNFLDVQPDVLAVAVSALPTATDEMRPPGRRRQQDIPLAPIWASPSHALLQDPSRMPLPLRMLLISLQSAESVVLTGEPQRIGLKAHFVNEATADTARRQLELATAQLKRGLTGASGTQSDRGTIGGLLVRGTFQVVGSDVIGGWPVDAELLRALQ